MKRLALALGLALLAAGCLTFARGDGPLMAIELFWDEDEDPATDDADNFEGGFCATADVERMEWALYDEDGDLVDAREEDCADAIDVIEPKPGVYQLEVTGYDDDGDARWGVCCEVLRVLRFDVAYACDIPQNGVLEETDHCSD